MHNAGAREPWERMCAVWRWDGRMGGGWLFLDTDRRLLTRKLCEDDLLMLVMENTRLQHGAVVLVVIGITGVYAQSHHPRSPTAFLFVVARCESDETGGKRDTGSLQFY